MTTINKIVQELHKKIVQPTQQKEPLPYFGKELYSKTTTTITYNKIVVQRGRNQYY